MPLFRSAYLQLQPSDKHSKITGDYANSRFYFRVTSVRHFFPSKDINKSAKVWCWSFPFQFWLLIYLILQYLINHSPIIHVFMQTKLHLFLLVMNLYTNLQKTCLVAPTHTHIDYYIVIYQSLFSLIQGHEYEALKLKFTCNSLRDLKKRSIIWESIKNF